MHHIILSLLAFFARLIVNRHRPYIIGVTGTVGKTTITTHVAHFLIKEYGIKNVQYSHYHYNGEYGLPLTIIGARSPGKNPFLWIWVFYIAVLRLMRSYPHYLVLEYGIDHPSEMDFLLSIAIPDIAIMTPVESNHLEQFGSLERYRNDKMKLIRQSNISIIHESLRQYIQNEAIYYSLGALSDVHASHIDMSITGTRAVAHYQHTDYALTLPAVGAFQVENILPLFPIADILNIKKDHISEYVAHSSPESGRSNILSGICGSTIIDGSYNGGYLSIHEGIISMRSFVHSHRIIFFLGDMRELGTSSQDIHEKVAHEICDLIPHENSVIFYLVGPMMRDYMGPILSTHFQVYTSLSSRSLGQDIATYIQKNQMDTIVYVKGSQNTIFLEEGIKYFLQNPDDRTKLPRQTSLWMKKKEVFFGDLNA